MSRTQMDLSTGPIFRKLVLFSLPIFFGALITEMYNLVDSMIVGRFLGANALAAVSACSPSTNIINLFLIGLQTGASVVVSQKMGARDKGHLQDAVSTIFALTLLSVAILVLGGVAIARPMLRLLDTPAEIFDDASAYLIIIFIGTSGNLIYNIGTGVLRGMGDSTWPFLFLVLCALLNLALDLLAVTVLDTGVWGVAAATAISQMVSGLGILLRMNRSDYGAKVNFRRLRIIRAEAMLMMSVAIPSAIQNIGNTLAGLFMQSYVNHFGADFVAANNIVNKLENFSGIVVAAFGSAICVFIGQNIGCRQMKRVHQGINISIGFLVGLGTLFCAAMRLMSNQLPLLFTDEEAVVRFAAAGIRIMCYTAITTGIDRVLVNAMRSTGQSVVPMITAQFGSFSRILFGYFLAMRRDDYMGIFYSLLLAAMARMLAIALYYYCGPGKKGMKRALSDT